MEEPIKTSKKILVVEDNQDSRELVVKVLTNKGYKIIEAVDGEEDLKKVSTEKPHLILMDISLPKLDGYEVAKRLKDNEEFKNIPIIAFTAHAMKGDKEKCISAGCDDYLTKPIKLKKLVRLIRRYFPAKSKEVMVSWSAIMETCGDEDIVEEIVKMFLEDAPGGSVVFFPVPRLPSTSLNYGIEFSLPVYNEAKRRVQDQTNYKNTVVVTKDGKEFSGHIRYWRPEENWFSIDYCGEDDLGVEKRFCFDDVESAITKEERIRLGVIGDQDQLERAREDLADGRKYGWKGYPEEMFDWERVDEQEKKVAEKEKTETDMAQ